MGLSFFGKREKIEAYTLPDPVRRKFTVDLAITFVIGFVVLIGLTMAGSLLYADAKATATVSFDDSGWRTHRYDSRSECRQERIADGDCMAAPGNDRLWQSEMRRRSQRFLDSFYAQPGEAFWLGIKVPAEKLKAAAKASAPVLILPKINGRVQVWFDGVFQTTHDYLTQRLPLQLTVSKMRLLQEKDLEIVMLVLPYAHSMTAEPNSEPKEGFFTTQDADHFARSVVFFSTSRHLIALGLFLLLAGFLWSVSRASRTRDYAVGTQLALLLSLMCLVSVDLSFRILNVSSFQSLFFTILVLEGVFVSRLTWTILRGSRNSTRKEGAAILAIALGAFFFVPWTWIETSGNNLLSSWVLPSIYLLCALVIGVRAAKLVLRPNGASVIRIEFLVIAAIAMGLTALSYFIESSQNAGVNVIWSRWFSFISLFGLVRVFTKSSKTKGSLIELSPTSRFHKLDSPIEKVEGWIVHLEVLKFSTDVQVMSTILSHLWTISALNGGDVIRSDSRSLILLFEHKDDGSDASHLVRALSEMAKCVKDLEQRLPIVFAEGGRSTSIVFRAAVLKGALKPGWRPSETGVARLPLWHEVEPLNSLAAARSLLTTDLDAVIRSNDTSVIAMKSDEAAELVEKKIVSSRARLEVEAPDTVAVFTASRLEPRSAAQKPVRSA
ncbi:MAG TPA: hypothetical protein VM432_11840 [Bdellovibrionales bacterium]|nr:hypothetical protein [Bdellovibrionales bacterium]